MVSRVSCVLTALHDETFVESNLPSLCDSVGWQLIDRSQIKPVTNARNSSLSAYHVRVINRLYQVVSRYLVCRRVALATSCDDSGTIHSDCAFFQPLDYNTENYFTFQTLQAVPLRAELVSLPKDLRLVSLLKCLPPSVCSILISPSTQLLRPHEAQEPIPRPYFFVSKHEYTRLIRRLVEVGMFTFTFTPKVINGLFGVPKSDGSIRLIVDARPVNNLFITPPAVHLPSPTMLTLW